MEKLLREFRERGEEVPPAVKEKIVLAHLPLIRFIVNQIGVRLPSHIELDELHNAGVIGLFDAINKYDERRGAPLKTYAEFRIKGAILDELRSLDWVPRIIRGKQRKLERARREVEQRLGRHALQEEIADALGIPVCRFYELFNQTRGTSLVNLEEMRGRGKNGEDIENPLEIIEDVRAINPFSVLANKETAEAVKAAIATLSKNEKAVISFYFYSDLSMDAIGHLLNVTESRICQIIDHACERLERRRELQEHND